MKANSSSGGGENAESSSEDDLFSADRGFYSDGDVRKFNDNEAPSQQ